VVPSIDAQTRVVEGNTRHDIARDRVGHRSGSRCEAARHHLLQDGNTERQTFGRCLDGKWNRAGSMVEGSDQRPVQGATPSGAMASASPAGLASGFGGRPGCG
jgi:hypothetical protein